MFKIPAAILALAWIVVPSSQRSILLSPIKSVKSAASPESPAISMSEKGFPANTSLIVSSCGKGVEAPVWVVRQAVGASAISYGNDESAGNRDDLGDPGLGVVVDIAVEVSLGSGSNSCMCKVGL